MNESAWFSSNTLEPMFKYLENTNNTCVNKLRKYRLFGVACCRRVQHLIVNEDIRKCLDEAECIAEGDCYPSWRSETIKTQGLFARGQIKDMDYWYIAYASTLCLEENLDPLDIAYNCRKSKETNLATEKEQCDILRDIVGNPFKKIELDRKPLVKKASGPFLTDYGVVDSEFTDETYCPYLTPDVIFLRDSAYFEKNSSHTLDSDKLGLLADALEEAGLPSQKCDKCKGRGELSCSRCSGEGCSAYGQLANGPCTSGDGCTFCGGRGEYKAKNYVKGRGIKPNSVLSALRGWEVCKKCIGEGEIGIVNLPNSSGDSSYHPCHDCYGSSLGRGWIKNDRDKYKGFWPLDLLMEKR